MLKTNKKYIIATTAISLVLVAAFAFANTPATNPDYFPSTPYKERPIDFNNTYFVQTISFEEDSYPKKIDSLTLEAGSTIVLTNLQLDIS